LGQLQLLIAVQLHTPWNAWANLHLLGQLQLLIAVQLHSHWNAWANLCLLGQPNTFLAGVGGGGDAGGGGGAQVAAPRRVPPADANAALTPPCIFHQRCSMRGVQGGVNMTLASAPRRALGAGRRQVAEAVALLRPLPSRAPAVTHTTVVYPAAGGGSEPLRRWPQVAGGAPARQPGGGLRHLGLRGAIRLPPQ
jgi:hypothetical protein